MLQGASGTHEGQAAVADRQVTVLNAGASPREVVATSSLIGSAATSDPASKPAMERVESSREANTDKPGDGQGARQAQLSTQERHRRLQVFLFTRPEEIELGIPLIRQLHAESPFAHLKFSERKARAQAMAYLKDTANRAAFYVLHRGRVVGIISLAVGPHYLSEDGLVATCLSFSVEPALRKSFLGGRVAALLLSTGRKWARAQGASILTIHGTSGYMGRLSKGATPIGINVAIELARNV